MIVVLSLISAFLYRLGGIFNTKIRDLGVPLIGLLTLTLLKIKAPFHIHLLSFLLYFGSLTTYWDRLFGYDNLYFHGFMCSLAYLSYISFGGNIVGFILRCIICSLLIGLINYLANKYSLKHSDWIEELSRGFVLNYTISLLR